MKFKNTGAAKNLLLLEMLMNLLIKLIIFSELFLLWQKDPHKLMKT